MRLENLIMPLAAAVAAPLISASPAPIDGGALGAHGGYPEHGPDYGAHPVGDGHSEGWEEGRREPKRDWTHEAEDGRGPERWDGREDGRHWGKRDWTHGAEDGREGWDGREGREGERW